MTTPDIPHFMGARIPRREDPALLRGEGKYTADIHLEGALHMVVVRSPCAHGRIREIDASEAEALEGVVAILSAADVNKHMAHPFPSAGMGSSYSVRRTPERYPLAAERMRHVGDPVAVILADNRYVAADAADLVFIDFEPLPVVVDP